MIESTLAFITDVLDRHLRTLLRSADEKVVLANLIDLDGSATQHTQNRVAVFLAQVEDVRMDTRPRSPEHEARAASDFALTIRFVVAARFEDYRETLKVLGHTLAFVHASPVLNKDGVPLTLSMETLNAQQLNELWTTIGCRYVPSLVCKVVATGRLE
jgi:Pvc16 N-terminal domain